MTFVVKDQFIMATRACEQPGPNCASSEMAPSAPCTSASTAPEIKGYSGATIVYGLAIGGK